MIKPSDLDIYLLGEGKLEEIWKVLGSHVLRDEQGQLLGTRFSVWAPNAKKVSLIHDGNGWNRTTEPLKRISENGIWNIFIEGVGPGERYKYAILRNDDTWIDHADPFAKATETPPLTASIVWESSYQFKDQLWQKNKDYKPAYKSPVSIYEVHLGSWKQGLSYRDFASEIIPYLQKMKFTHIEFLPLTEHPYGPSWGYQVTSFYAPSSRYGTPDDFKYLIDQLHQNGFGVIMDWVPAHFPKDEWALKEFDGTALFEHQDPRMGQHPDWGTLIFNYDRHEVRNFLIGSALYWIEEFHIDGIRVDAVASMLYLDYSRKAGEWIPNIYGSNENLGAISFLKELNTVIYKRNPHTLMIAEESTAWPGVTKTVDYGGLGFGFKWNMGWMHDSLEYFSRESIHRKYHHFEITNSISYAFSENYILPLSHDEVVHGKGSLISRMPGDRWQALANLRVLFGLMWSHPGKKLLFMGSEFAQSNEWNEGNSLWWELLNYQEHQQTSQYLAKLNEIYQNHSQLYELDNSANGFIWLRGDEVEKNLMIFARQNQVGNQIIAIHNFSPTIYHNYQIPAPKAGEWKLILNSDDITYGGSGVVIENCHTISGEFCGFSQSLCIDVPPLATVMLELIK